MHKKVWVYILIIVVISSLFPSVLIAKADGGGGAGGIPVEDDPPHDIPDLEYDLQDAPFPGGTYMGFTKSNWQSFLDRAEQLGHTRIYKISGATVYYEAGNTGSFWQLENNKPYYFSSDGSASFEIYNQIFIDEKGPLKDGKYRSPGEYKAEWGIRFLNGQCVNFISSGGHYTEGIPTYTDYDGVLISERVWHKFKDWPRGPSEIEIDIGWHIETYYDGELNDPYQDKPERYNIDPTRGWGMSFLKPAFGDWINIPRKLGTYRDTIEIEIQMPQIYEANDGITYKMYDVTEGIGNIAVPNFGIRLYSHNAGRIEGSQVVGREGIWILPNNIRFVEGFMDGIFMHGAKFIASIPIEHARPENMNHSLIVADLVIHKSGGLENYSVEIPEARTWTKYLIYYGVVDEDGDGYDDRTGLPIDDGGKPGESIKDDKPNKDDYDDGILGTISYYFDTFIWYIKQPFVFIADLIGNIINWITTTIDGWIDGFTSIFTTLFSFLPAEIILMLALGFATIMIITIIRAIRGS